MAEASTNVVRLTPSRDRPYFAANLALALHKLGRDDEALTVVEKAIEAKKSYFASEIPREASSAFRRRCLERATELRPKDYELWWYLGSETPDRKQRVAALEQVIALCSDKKLILFNETRALPFKEKAKALLASKR